MPHRYVQFGKAYRRFRDLQALNACKCLMAELAESPLEQMMMIATILHEKAGTNPNFARYQQESILGALDGRREAYDDHVLNHPDFHSKVWDRFQALCSGKSNKKNTFGPVAETLALLYRNQTTNWVSLFRKWSVEQAWRNMDDLHGVGPKLASFVLREFQSFLDVWSEVDKDNWHFFQPIDRWVLRIASLTWPNKVWPITTPQDSKSYEQIARRIVEDFETFDQALDFNMGAWFLGAMRREVTIQI